jgi:hypothetical protein
VAASQAMKTALNGTYGCVAMNLLDALLYYGVIVLWFFSFLVFSLMKVFDLD